MNGLDRYNPGGMTWAEAQALAQRAQADQDANMFRGMQFLQQYRMR